MGLTCGFGDGGSQARRSAISFAAFTEEAQLLERLLEILGYLQQLRSGGYQWAVLKCDRFSYEMSSIGIDII